MRAGYYEHNNQLLLKSAGYVLVIIDHHCSKVEQFQSVLNHRLLSWKADQ